MIYYIVVALAYALVLGVLDSEYSPNPLQLLQVLLWPAVLAHFAGRVLGRYFFIRY